MANVAIIGAGPAGLFAAEHLAQAGLRVTVYDRKPSAARKFLMAGRGGLNITHSEPFETFITRYGAAAEFLRPALENFTPSAMRDWCTGLGEETFIGSSGRVFPKSFKASPLLRAWLGRLNELGVTVAYDHQFNGFDDRGALLFTTPDGAKTIAADATLLAMGGASWPRLGSDGGWAAILRARGIDVRPFAPSNCGFYVQWSDVFAKKFAGTPLKSITLTHGDTTIRGELMITTNGVEGGGIYALSAGLRDHLPATLYIDLKPDMDLGTLTAAVAKPIGRDSFSNHIRKTTGLAPAAIGLLQEDRALRDAPPAQLAQRVKRYPLHLSAPFGLERAISSAGGVSRDEINSSYMIKKLPGVFVAGEMIDWEAPTGGYLLQASFATGAAAAAGITAYLKR